MSSFKAHIQREAKRRDWLKRFYKARNRDLWNEVLPYLVFERQRLRMGKPRLIPEKIYRDECWKYYVDFGDYFDGEIKIKKSNEKIQSN